MTRTPPEQTIDRLVDTLEKVDWRKLRMRLKDAARRDRSGSATPDGYPSSTLGEGRGGSELTPTESAANQRIWGRGRDNHHEFTVTACDMLDQAVMSLNAVLNNLARIDALSEVAESIDLGEQDCESCARHPSLTPRAKKHFTDVAGSLTRKWRLCGPCYQFVYGQGTVEASLPSLGQLEEYDRRGTWKIRAFEGGLSR